MVANREQSVSISEQQKVEEELRTKLKGYDFYHKVLGSPRYVVSVYNNLYHLIVIERILLQVAPMVDQSELSWRMLCRKYKAELCYSPMFHSTLFASDLKYRRDALQTCPGDRPLIIQVNQIIQPPNSFYQF